MADARFGNYKRMSDNNKYHDSKVHDWWLDDEFNEYYALLETIEGQLRLIITPKQKKIK